MTYFYFQVTTVNQETAEVNKEPLMTLGTFRSGKMMSLIQSKEKVTVFPVLKLMNIVSAFVREKYICTFTHWIIVHKYHCWTFASENVSKAPVIGTISVHILLCVYV